MRFFLGMIVGALLIWLGLGAGTQMGWLEGALPEFAPVARNESPEPAQSEAQEATEEAAETEEAESTALEIEQSTADAREAARAKVEALKAKEAAEKAEAAALAAEAAAAAESAPEAEPLAPEDAEGEATVNENDTSSLSPIIAPRAMPLQFARLMIGGSWIRAQALDAVDATDAAADDAAEKKTEEALDAASSEGGATDEGAESGAQTAEGEPADAPVEPAGPLVNDRVDYGDETVIEIPEDEADNNDAPTEPVIRQGENMTITEPILDAPVAKQNDSQEPAHPKLPENILLIVTEGADHRLALSDVENLPQAVRIAVWPDSDVIASGRRYYLLTPPVDIMESYRLQNVVADEGAIYAENFPASEGIFARKMEALAKADEFSKLIYAQLAEKQKGLVLLSTYVDPNMPKAIEETQLNFDRVDYILKGNSNISLAAQWDAILTKAQHGEELNIMYELGPEGSAALNRIFE